MNQPAEPVRTQMGDDSRTCQTERMASTPGSDLTGQTVELLQEMIRNECVNDGTPESGFESRNATTLRHLLEGSGLDVQEWEPIAGRASIVSRIQGSDPSAPSLCLMGHTDVVPVTPSGWSRDPFGGELVKDPRTGQREVWGRGAVDMLNITSSMAVAFRHLADTGFRPKGDLVYFGVADEESGSAWGAEWFKHNQPDAIAADYVLTESGGLHGGTESTPTITVNVGEKGISWRRLRVKGTPGHGSRPFRSDNALVKAAAVVQRLAEYRPTPRFHELWTQQVAMLDVDEESKAAMLDPNRIDQWLDNLPINSPAAHLYSCTHTTFSPNVVSSDSVMKNNVIPDQVDINVDIRTMPGDNEEEIRAHLNEALGDLADKVEVEILMHHSASMSSTNTPLWDSLQKAVGNHFPHARLSAQLIVGFTDSRVFREMGATAYGAGLFSPELSIADYGTRFHGNDERIDVESLRLSTQLWIDVAKDLLS